MDAALAESQAVPSSQKNPSSDGLSQFTDPSRAQCSQGCLYQRSNEVLSLEAAYLVQKYEILERADEGVRRRNLAEFCDRYPDTRIGSAGGGSVDQDKMDLCWKRWSETVAWSLRDIRGSQGKNRESAQALDSTWDRSIESRPQKGRPVSVPIMKSSGISEKGQAPYVPTLAQLDPQLDSLRKAMAQAPGEVADRNYAWLERRGETPTRDDFIKWKEIPRDPSYPEGEKLFVPEKLPNGQIAIDEKKYQEALASYQASTRKSAAQLKKDTQGLTAAQRIQKYVAQPATIASRGHLEAQLTPETRKAFFLARKIMIDSVREGFDGKKRERISKAVPSSENVRQDGGVGSSRNPAGAPADSVRTQLRRNSPGLYQEPTGKEQLPPPPPGKEQRTINLETNPKDFDQVIDDIEKQYGRDYYKEN